MKLPQNFLILSKSAESHIEIQEELMKRNIDFLGGDGKPRNLPHDEILFHVSAFTGVTPCLFYGPPSSADRYNLPYMTIEEIRLTE